MSDDSADSIEEPERDEDKTPAEVAKTSEVMSKRTMRGVKKAMSKKQNTPNPPNRGSAEGKDAQEAQPRVDFRDILNDFVGGFTPQQLADKYKLSLDTVKRKIPKLQLEAKREEEHFRAKMEREGMQIVPKLTIGEAQLVPNVRSAPNPGVQNPSVPPVAVQNPPSTYTVPAVPAGVVLPPIQPVPAVSAPAIPPIPPTLQTSPATKGGETEEDGVERRDTPRWLRHDGGELVNTGEMAIRGVQSKETFRPITDDSGDSCGSACRTSDTSACSSDFTDGDFANFANFTGGEEPRVRRGR
jgi:hypothetical protein